MRAKVMMAVQKKSKVCWGGKKEEKKGGGKGGKLSRHYRHIPLKGLWRCRRSQRFVGKERRGGGGEGGVN